MSKNTNLSFLTDYITADITNGRIGINNASPTVAFDVTGVSKFTGASTFSTTVGIGTTSPNASWGATIANSTLYSSNALRLERNGIPTQGLNISAGGENVTFNAFNTASDGLNSSIVFTSTAFNTTTERMRISSTGNVGIGTSSPSAITGYTSLSVNNATNGGIIELMVNNVVQGRFFTNSTTYVGIGSVSNVPLVFNTNDTERMRITSGGNIGIGNTGGNTVKVSINSVGTTSSTYGMIINDSTGNTTNLQIRDDGYGYLRAASWAYGSDRRIKENISDVSNGLDLIIKLKPKHFDYINGAKDNLGFIAQDVQELIPQAVSISDEKTGMLGLKTDFIIPYLVKSIQELSAEITIISNKIK